MYQPDLSSPCADYDPSITPFTFPLDPFQQHAVVAINNDHNVFVCAKTGSGKTLVGEYQIHYSLSKGRRVFYTTPIKSLSNQKFHDLKGQFPTAKVGIMTGDIKFAPDADILVMTTEILRNLLYKRGTATEHLGLTASISLDCLDAVIFDECHYINDPDRGRIWEETMILLPPEIKLVALSATLASPHLFTSWLASVRERPTALIQTTYRIVPLTHTVLNFDKEEFTPILDAKEQFQDYAYNNWLHAREKSIKAHEAYQRQVRSARAQGHEGPVEGKTRPKDFVHELNTTVDILNRRQLLPALVFVLSRKGCEQLAAKITADLLTSSETASVRHIINFHLSRYSQDLEKLPQYHNLCTLLAKGIAFHHSGLLPVLKEIVELLFTRGLVRLLFATETFAVGLNMPTKTVIFTGLKKYDDRNEGMRLLRTDEYTQMAGRAGRRGKDKEGLVIYLPDREPLSLHDMRQVLKGPLPPICSRMTFHYDFLLKTLQSNTLSWLKIQNQSYWSTQRTEQLAAVETAKAKAQASADTLISLHGKDTFAEIAKKQEIEAALRLATNAKRKELQRQLNQWNDRHLGPRWVNGIRSYQQYILHQADVTSAEEELAEAARTVHRSVEEITQFLLRAGFLTGVGTTTSITELTSANLTLKGTLASEVNEGHCILMPELFISEITRPLSPTELLQVLAAFLEGEKSSDPAVSAPHPSALNTSSQVKDILYKADEIAQRYVVLEDSINPALSPADYWMLDTFWIEPLTAWIEGGDIGSICQQFGIFEGNFTRAVLKAANLCDEWLSLALFCQVPSEVEKINTLRPLLMRGAVQPDSLYLRL
jgi:superfamily II RNA helicase